jgi:hypothetical protein
MLMQTATCSLGLYVLCIGSHRTLSFGDTGQERAEIPENPSFIQNNLKLEILIQDLRDAILL